MSKPSTNGRIRLLATAFVIYYHLDLDKCRQFLSDFGLVVAEDRGNEVFYRGYGTEPILYVARQARDKCQFGGAVYEVESREELERATKIDRASAISLFEGPGGGDMVTLTDPVGHKLHLIHGQTKRQLDEMGLKKLTVNYEDEKPRKGKFQRFTPGPAPVYRWGHYGVSYPEGRYQDMMDWYTGNLALSPSDVVYRGGKPITCFFHIDRGLEYTDHHAFFFKMAKPGQQPGVAHAAFEVHDFDIQQLGHQHLQEKGYQLCWGVGRVSALVASRPFLCSMPWWLMMGLACAGKSSF